MNDLTIISEKVGETTVGLDKTIEGFEIWLSDNVESYRTAVKLDLSEQEAINKFIELRHKLINKEEC